MDFEYYAEIEYLQRQIEDMLEDADLDELREIYSVVCGVVGE